MKVSLLVRRGERYCKSLPWPWKLPFLVICAMLFHRNQTIRFRLREINLGHGLRSRSPRTLLNSTSVRVIEVFQLRSSFTLQGMATQAARKDTRKERRACHGISMAIYPQVQESFSLDRCR